MTDIWPRQIYEKYKYMGETNMPGGGKDRYLCMSDRYSARDRWIPDLRDGRGTGGAQVAV